MSVQINIECPCCGTSVDVKEHRGIIINRRAWLGSQLVALREQLNRLEKRITNPPSLTQAALQNQIEVLTSQIEDFESELKIVSLL